MRTSVCVVHVCVYVYVLSVCVCVCFECVCVCVYQFIFTRRLSEKVIKILSVLLCIKVYLYQFISLY